MALIEHRPLSLVTALQRASSAIAAFLDASSGLKISSTEALVLAYLHARGSARVGDIQIAFGFRKSTLTSIFNRLEDRGLITCRVNAADRRSLIIGLTPQGAAAASQIHDQLVRLEQEILGSFSARDQKASFALLAAVQAASE